jgi:hypothetical protein
MSRTLLWSLAGVASVAGFGVAPGSEEPTLTGVKVSGGEDMPPPERFAVTLDQLKVGLQTPGVVGWGNPNTQMWSCVDGRSTVPVFGTPGGDAGEWLAAFSALYPDASPEVKARPLGELTKDLFLKYLEEEITEERPFYMHTDMESTDKVKEQLKCDSNACTLFFPDPDDEEQLKALLGDPDATYVGCGHLKYMVQRPEDYGTDPKIVISMIQAFYEYAWAQPDSSKLKLEVHDHDHNGHEFPYGGQEDEQSGKVLIADLPGPHEEGAVLTVATENADPAEDCVAPKVTPSFTNADGEYHQYFVDHSLSPAVNGLRRKNTAFFAKHFGIENTDGAKEKVDAWNDKSHYVENQLDSTGDYDGSYEDFVASQMDQVKGVADGKLLTTVGILASTLPIVTAEFESEGGSAPRC